MIVVGILTQVTGRFKMFKLYTYMTNEKEDIQIDMCTILHAKFARGNITHMNVTPISLLFFNTWILSSIRRMYIAMALVIKHYAEVNINKTPEGSVAVICNFILILR